jgi:DNA polymerase-3 subunit alpha
VQPTPSRPNPFDPTISSVTAAHEPAASAALVLVERDKVEVDSAFEAWKAGPTGFAKNKDGSIKKTKRSASQISSAASDVAGFTLAEADTLRKAIGKKIKELLDQQGVKLIAGLIKNGIPERTAHAIWDLFPPFARYGFNRSHAACYAMIAYRTAYLKARYPTEFMTALLNADSGDVERISFLIGECKKMNVEVLPPDINKSSQKFAPEGSNIRFGLDAIKNVGTNIVAAIIEARSRGGEFANFTDLLSRVQHKDLNKKSLESLTKCGALDSFGIERNTILQNIDEITKFAQAARKTSAAGQSTSLFGSAFVSTAAPKALQLKPAEPATKKDKLAWEKELLGLYVSDHPLAVANSNGAVAAMKPTRIKDMLAEKSTVKNYRICGMVASVKSIITKTGKPMCFAKIEDQSGAVEVVAFSEIFAKNPTCWKEGAVVVLVGKLNFRNGEISMLADQIKEIS